MAVSWRKSTYSGGQAQSDCVEVMIIEDRAA